MPRKPHNFGEIIPNEIWKFFSVTLYCGSVVAYHGSRFVLTNTKKFITLEIPMTNNCIIRAKNMRISRF